MLTLASITEEIDSLEPVSGAAAKVMALLGDLDAGASDLAEIIRHEPSLTANVLKLANSSYFGLPQKFHDASQAIIYLGMVQVVDLVLMVACSKTFDGAHDGYGLGGGALWKSAVAGAAIASGLAEQGRAGGSRLLFTGALLRDIGKIVLNQHVEKEVVAIQNLVQGKAVTLQEAEREVLGVDHARIGALLAKTWHFPPMLQCIIANSHTPLKARSCRQEASLVYVADAICRKMGITCGLDDATYVEDQQVAKSLGLPVKTVEQVAEAFEGKVEQFNALFA